MLDEAAAAGLSESQSTGDLLDRYLRDRDLRIRARLGGLQALEFIRAYARDVAQEIGQEAASPAGAAVVVAAVGGEDTSVELVEWMRGVWQGVVAYGGPILALSPFQPG
jgi:hypothetical protein